MKLLLLILFFSFSLTSIAQVFNDYRNDKSLNVNNLEINLNNLGSLAEENSFHPPASWKILIGNNTIVFDQGVWVIGKINDSLHLGISKWLNFYSAGPIINNQPAMQILPEDSLKYRIYKITKGDSELNADYNEWPFEFGAPTNLDGSPKFYGHQTLWTVFNAFDNTVAQRHLFIYGELTKNRPLPVEIQQLAYAHKFQENHEFEFLNNVVFFEWTIINKGTVPITETYFSFWTDIDFNNAGAEILNE